MTANTSDLVAAFLAKGGKVAKVASDATNGMTSRDWHRAARDVPAAKVIGDDSDAFAYEREAETFGAARMNGASVSEALDASRGYSQDARGRYWSHRR